MKLEKGIADFIGGMIALFVTVVFIFTIAEFVHIGVAIFLTVFIIVLFLNELVVGCKDAC